MSDAGAAIGESFGIPTSFDLVIIECSERGGTVGSLAASKADRRCIRLIPANRIAASQSSVPYGSHGELTIR
jgi:hypothetical protein